MLKVHSIFESISGEAGYFPQGSWCTFIRLQGCNLHCKGCDTPEALSVEGGRALTPDECIKEINPNIEQVLITGGEPLLQDPDWRVLVTGLYRRGQHCIQIETNGSYELPVFTHIFVNWVIDYKGSSSGMNHMMTNIPSLLARPPLNERIYIKFVIGNKEDLDQAIFVMNLIKEINNLESFIISAKDAKPGYIKGAVNILEREHPELLPMITFSLQLHKILGLK